jgi:hypothetical protein
MLVMFETTNPVQKGTRPHNANGIHFRRWRIK